MKVDMHIHSFFSDGEFTPLELLQRAKDLDLDVIAITDHNNIKGGKEAIKLNSNVKVIPGIEFSAKSPRGTNIHILGYNIDLENEELNDITAKIMNDNVARIKSLFYQLNKSYNVFFKEDDIYKVLTSDRNIGRPEVGKLCIKYGYVKTVREAFAKLFEPLDDKLQKRRYELTEKDCIKYILSAGGIPCLAHPVTLNKNFKELNEYIAKLVNNGLEAVEVYHSNNSKELVLELEKITKKYNLLTSLGSDFHGPIVTPEIKMGSGIDNNLIGKHPTILSEIKEV